MSTVMLEESIRFGREICGDLAQAERREWWLSNGRGAYAAGTIAGTLTRRYHGLLIAPLRAPLGRYLVVAKADATLLDGERAWPLHTNRWGSGAVDPRGHVHLESFHLDGRMPVWRYAIGDVVLEQCIWMEPGADTTYIAYRLQPGPAAVGGTRRLRVRLLANARDHHGNTARGDFHPRIETVGEAPGQVLWVRHPEQGGTPAYDLRILVRGGTIEADGTWIEHFDLPIERERGLPAYDNHLSVAQVTLDLIPGEWVGMVASLDDRAAAYLEEAMRRFRAYDAALLANARVRVPQLSAAPAWIQQLVLAADSFVFARPLPNAPDGESVIAGYPWFGDWGRDTMIALPGLTLATGRYDSARRILETFARFVDRGMLPNVFPGNGETPEYNTVDAALWYFEAWRAFLAVHDDRAALRKIFPILDEMIRWHVDGTRHGIGMDPNDGLLRAGEPGVQLTWMDAKVGDWVITPRIGKPVEINALWYNALRIMALFARRLDRDPRPYESLAAQARDGFQRFVDPAGAGLFDVLDGPQGHDASVRPNQIFAVSLPFSPLTREVQERVVRACADTLLCSYGLRSLAAMHPDYRPVYQGGVWERDSAYHQGPVWAWLLGHFALAEFKLSGDAQAAQNRLAPIRDHLSDAGLGTVSEIFDGDAPHTPRGAPAQAWSVACILEAWWQLERSKKSVARDPNTGSPRPTVVEFSASKV